jgi:hypothetical protein
MAKPQRAEPVDAAAPTPDSLRADLAKAIRKRDKAHAVNAEQRQAEARARALLTAAEERHAQAEAALLSSRSLAAKAVAAAARAGTSPPPAVELHAARAELADAEDALQAAQSALQECAPRAA